MRACRFALAATLFLFIGAAPPPDDEAYSEKSNSQTHIEQSLASIANSQARAVEKVDPGEYERPCKPGKDNYKSDLCAQWTAANAAADSAKWTWWSLVLGIVGTIGLLLNLAYTRRAVMTAEAANRDADKALNIAERNADAAASHVQVAEKSARHQLRPYIAVQSVVFKESGDFDIPENEIRLEIINNGQTPGNIEELKVACLWLVKPVQILLSETRAIGHELHSDTPTGMSFGVRSVEDDSIGKMFVSGTLIYTDIFGGRHTSFFYYMSKGGLAFHEMDNPTRLSAAVDPRLRKHAQMHDKQE